MANGFIALAIVAVLFAVLQIMAAETGESNQRPRVEPTDGWSVFCSVVLWLVVAVVLVVWAAERDRQERVRDASYHNSFTNEVE